MAQPKNEAIAEPDDLVVAIEAAIDACDGDAHAALRALIIANRFLEVELEETRAKLSRGFVRGKMRVRLDREDRNALMKDGQKAAQGDNAPVLPDNLVQLHEGEEFLRQRSIEFIQSDEDAKSHLLIIEGAMDLLDYFVRHFERENEEQLTIQLLGIRLFNGSASTLKLLLSGYYQTAAAIQRDLLETIFLLDYLKTDHSLIPEWRQADKKTRMGKFGPARVRIFLDERDGFTERKREQAYNLLCELAAHPTYMGFQMLTPVPGGKAHRGPFFEASSMKANLAELAKHMVQAAQNFASFFGMRGRKDFGVRMRFIELQSAWMDKFFGKGMEPSALAKMRQIFSQLPE